MRVLIVVAHHEPGSFNHAMLSAALDALSRAGHEVRVSDLYAMKFDPVSDRRNFTTVADPDRLDQQVEERFAARHGGFAADVEQEIEKVRWCNLLILQFPMWWMGMPAIMKGWIDRVFALDVAYGGGRWFDQGWLAGKKAMVSMTVGGTRAAYSEGGLYGPIDDVMHPLHHGLLAFVGFSIVEPFVVYGPGRMDVSQRAQVLSDYRARLTAIDTAPLLPQLRSADYEDFVRRTVQQG